MILLASARRSCTLTKLAIYDKASIYYANSPCMGNFPLSIYCASTTKIEMSHDAFGQLKRSWQLIEEEDK